MTADEILFREELQTKSREELIETACRLMGELRAAQIRLDETSRGITEMSLQFSQMQDTVRGLESENRFLKEENERLTAKSTLRTKDVFGRSTEKADDILRSCLQGSPDDPLDEDASDEKKDGSGGDGKEDAHDGPSCTGRKHGTGKKKGTRSANFSSLPHVKEFELNIEELNETYGEGNWRIAFWRCRRTIESQRTVRYVREAYAPVISIGLEHMMKSVPHRNVLLWNSYVSPSLLAEIFYNKFCLSLPFYRQSQDMAREGVIISRQTMSNWCVNLSLDLLAPVYDFLSALNKNQPYHQCDETTLTVIRDGRSAGTVSYIWAHVTSELSEERKIFIYCYEMTRHTDHLRSYYSKDQGKRFISCDAYTSYHTYEKEMDGSVIISGCFMHARRRFANALQVVDISGMTEEAVNGLPETKAIQLIAEIYMQENPLKEQSPDERHLRRQSDVRPKVDAYFDFIHSFDLKDPALSATFRDAVSYSVNQETYLRQFLEDPHIPIDNGFCERSFKNLCVGRRNWLFCNTPDGAEATVIVYSLIETAKANGANPYYYLKYLLEEMPKHMEEEGRSFLEDMVPWCDRYRKYEEAQIRLIAARSVGEDQEKPLTPKRRKRRAS